MDDALGPRDWLRLGVLGLASLYLLGGPAVPQLLGERDGLWPEWVMFVGFGLDVCKVEYRLARPDGEHQALDRFDVLGVEHPMDGPRSLWRVPDAETADRHGQRMCHKLSVPRPDLRVYATCARRSGWKQERDGSVNVCTGKPAEAP